MAPSLTILELAQSILKDATVLDQHFQSHGLPQPSFDKDGPSMVAFRDPETSQAHERLLSSTKALQLLARGPVNAINVPHWMATNAAAISVIDGFNISERVPLDGQVSYEELSTAVGIPRTDLKSILRMAMTDFVFHEPSPGFVAHTAASRVLVDSPLARSLVKINIDEMMPAMSKLRDAMLQHPGSQEPQQSAWSLENNAKLPLFDELAARHPARAATFSRAMENYASRIPASTVTSAVDWASYGEAVVVDVGGGKGPAAIALAQAFPKLNIIVQDLGHVCAQGREQLPEDVKGRVSFEEHDFFTPQPMRDIDVFYIRAVFHNWPDKYCIEILRNLIPGLKKGSRVVIQDPMFPESGKLSPFAEEFAIAGDLRMMALFNSHDREVKEWVGLVAKADPRFQFRHVGSLVNPVSKMGTFEITWQG